jgi:hypothetical protein
VTATLAAPRKVTWLWANCQPWLPALGLAPGHAGVRVCLASRRRSATRRDSRWWRRSGWTRRDGSSSPSPAATCPAPAGAGQRRSAGLICGCASGSGPGWPVVPCGTGSCRRMTASYFVGHPADVPVEEVEPCDVHHTGLVRRQAQPQRGARGRRVAPGRALTRGAGLRRPCRSAHCARVGRAAHVTAGQARHPIGWWRWEASWTPDECPRVLSERGLQAGFAKTREALPAFNGGRRASGAWADRALDGAAIRSGRASQVGLRGSRRASRGHGRPD